MPFENITPPPQESIELAVKEIDVTATAPLPTTDLTGEELLGLVLTEMREMNFHLSCITGEQVGELVS